MGALLKQIYEKQLDGEIKTTEEGIALASQMLSLSPNAETQRSTEVFCVSVFALRTNDQAARSCARRNSSSSRGTLVPTECSVGDQPERARARAADALIQRQRIGIRAELLAGFFERHMAHVGRHRQMAGNPLDDGIDRFVAFVVRVIDA